MWCMNKTAVQKQPQAGCGTGTATNRHVLRLEQCWLPHLWQGFAAEQGMPPRSSLKICITDLLSLARFINKMTRLQCAVMKETQYHI